MDRDAVSEDVRWMLDGREEIVKPIPKGENGREVKNNRGILLNTLYKMYEKLHRLQGKLKDIQAGFRRGRSTTVNLYLLNYVAKK